VIAVIAAIGSASWFLLQRHSTKPLLSMFRFRAIPAISAIFLETLFRELSIHLLHRLLPRRRGELLVDLNAAQEGSQLAGTGKRPLLGL
jgi:hypothetical protein